MSSWDILYQKPEIEESDTGGWRGITKMGYTPNTISLPHFCIWYWYDAKSEDSSSLVETSTSIFVQVTGLMAMGAYYSIQFFAVISDKCWPPFPWFQRQTHAGLMMPPICCVMCLWRIKFGIDWKFGLTGTSHRCVQNYILAIWRYILLSPQSCLFEAIFTLGEWLEWTTKWSPELCVCHISLASVFDNSVDVL